MAVEYNSYGEPTMGGTSLKTIAQSFGTPTIAYDENQIRAQMQRLHQAFKKSNLKYSLSVASKAFAGLLMLVLVQDIGRQLDVAPEGDLYASLDAVFEPQHIRFRGNNKTKHEIQYALESKVGYIVLDALEEIELIDKD